jgi:5-methyltetrahydropteroyltriglutamate--homocysteine methyltransferase
MQQSTHKILTTHAGSLPRPQALIALHKAKFEGTAVSESDLQQAITAASRAAIAKQIEAGLDVVNNGEMGRESFFTYLQHRMTGFGGTTTRPIMADLRRYSGSLERRQQAMGSDERVNLLRAPKAISQVRYVNREPIEQECQQLGELLGEQNGRYTEAFVSAPSPGIIAAGMQNDHYDSLEEYVNALGEALRVEYTAVAEAGFILQIDAQD